jgi:hypothetical protein
MAGSPLWRWMWMLAWLRYALGARSQCQGAGKPRVRDERACVAWCPSPQVRNPKGDDREPTKTYTFDQVYDHTSQQQELFDITAKPIIDSCMEGYNGTIFAYGQVQPCQAPQLPQPA